MLVILEAVAGPVTGRRIETKPGTILRIGRTARSDYALSEDSYLSSLHFAVENDGLQARIRDLGSSNGTFVNGSKVTEQVVQPGDSLTAGGSTFTIHIETEAPAGRRSDLAAYGRAAPTPLLTPVPTQMIRAQPEVGATAIAVGWGGFSRPQSNLLQHLYGHGEPVFAILDATRDSRIPAFLEASGERFLAIDPTGRVQAYLVGLAPSSRLLDVMIKDGWGRGWCSYLTGQTSVEVACAQLASYLTLYTVHGQPFTLRFWEPRVLRVLTPMMPPDEAAYFFGPFSRIIVEGEKPDTALQFSLSPRGPALEMLNL